MNMNGMGGGFTIPAHVFLEDRRPQMERAIQFAEEEKRKRVGNKISTFQIPPSFPKQALRCFVGVTQYPYYPLKQIT